MRVKKIKQCIKSNRRNIAFQVLGVVIIGIMIWKVGIDKIYLQFLRIDNYLLAEAFFLSLVSIILKVYRWNSLFFSVKRSESTSVYLIGLAVNQILPIGFGEAARAYVAKDRFGIPAGKTLASVAIERITDFTFLTAMSFGCFAFLTIDKGLIFQVLIPFIIILLGYYFLLRPHLFETQLLRFQHMSHVRFKNDSLEKVVGRIISVLKVFIESIDQFNARRIIIYKAVVITIMAWIIYGTFIYVLLLAFGISIYVPYVIAITAASELIGTFSFIPGGMGAKDLSFAVLLLPFGVPMETAISTFLMARLITYIQLGVGATGSVLTFSKK